MEVIHDGSYAVETTNRRKPIMKMRAPLFLYVLAAASPAIAQQVPARAPVELTAEHQVWEAEHRRWATEHAKAADTLRAVADQITRGDRSLAVHGGEIATHGAALARGGDSATLAREHAQLRAEHEETRIAHHRFMDSVRATAEIAGRDESVRSVEQRQK